MTRVSQRTKQQSVSLHGFCLSSYPDYLSDGLWSRSARWNKSFSSQVVFGQYFITAREWSFKSFVKISNIVNPLDKSGGHREPKLIKFRDEQRAIMIVINEIEKVISLYLTDIFHETRKSKEMSVFLDTFNLKLNQDEINSGMVQYKLISSII